MTGQQSGNDYTEKDIQRYKNKPNYIVTDRSQLLAALEEAAPYSIIYVKGNAQIDLSGEKNIIIKEGIKLIGDRKKNKKELGAVLFTSNAGVHPFFKVDGDNVLIYGVTIVGDDGNVLVKDDSFEEKKQVDVKNSYMELYHNNMYATPVSSGVATQMRNLVIDNCELSQWTYTAVYVRKGAENIQIKNSYIHHNQRFGLGYGITIDQGEAIITNNVFNYNRHSIASTGREGSRYTVEGNLFCKDGNNTWAIDMHGGKDWNDGTNIAGDYAIVRDNVFYITGKGQAFVIRGKSLKKSIITGNVVYKDKMSLISAARVFEQVNAKGNLEIKDNKVKLK
ncbi:hypothetical protein GCM10027454_19910 [Algoriphagus aestuariicola]